MSPRQLNPESSIRDRIQVVGAHFERGGRPWIPVTGEIHYARIPRSRWKQTLAQAASGGLNTVACYVFWRYHEPTPGRFCWEDNLDLRGFVEFAAEAGLDVVVRLGPWAHGEARFGGFPDWLMEADCTPRTNDPVYLRFVERFYAETIGQLAGLCHADGGPIIAAQVENELHQQPEHLARLREMAEELGLHLPLWTATGWGGAKLPGTVLPVWSGYADGFWAEADEEFPDFARPHFCYSHQRDDHGVGADVRLAAQAGSGPQGGDGNEDTVDTSAGALPFATCELGGGMHVAYHRRPLVTAEDVAALALAKIGSGSVWQGYYMYVGGSHRRGHPDGEQESQVTGYPNDMPQISYDFHAPIGEHGQIRPHYHRLRRQHLWLRSEGQRIACMTPKIAGIDFTDPCTDPQGAQDLSGPADPQDPLRWAVRDDGAQGYLFLSTYQPAVESLAAQASVQLQAPCGAATLTVPHRPVDIPAGISTVWPLNFSLPAGLTLISATAEVITRAADAEGDLLILCVRDGIPAELVLNRRVPVSGPAQFLYEAGAAVVVPTVPPGKDCLIQLGQARILLLDEATADQLYRLRRGDRDELLLSAQPVWVGDDVLVTETVVRRDALITNAVLAEDGERAPAPRRGGPQHRLSVTADWSGAYVLDVPVPPDAFDEGLRSMLRLTFVADAARAVIPGTQGSGDQESAREVLVSDHFWHGRDWEFELTPWRREIQARGLQIHLLPRRRADGVWIHPEHRHAPDGARVHLVELTQLRRGAPPPGTVHVLGHTS